MAGVAEDHQPTTFGRYQIRSELGRGSYGVVYLAWDPEIQSEVALKALAIPDASLDERFLDEARLMRSLDSSGVVDVHDLGVETTEIGAQPYFVMEYCERGTLAERLDQFDRGLTVSEALGLVEAIGSAAVPLVSPARGPSNGVVHRDLKPSNMLIRRVPSLDRQAVGELLAADERLIVSDFGIAKPVDPSATHLTRSIGTYPWAAPEQTRPYSDIRHDPDFKPPAAVGLSADVYSASVIVVSAMVKSTPEHASAFTDSDFARTAPLERELRKGLARNPRDRHSNLVEWSQAIKESPAVLSWPSSKSPANKDALRSIANEAHSDRRVARSIRSAAVILASIAVGAVVVLALGSTNRAGTATGVASNDVAKSASSTTLADTVTTVAVESLAGPIGVGPYDDFSLVDHKGHCLSLPYEDDRSGRDLGLAECTAAGDQKLSYIEGRLLVMEHCFDIEEPSGDEEAIAEIWTCEDNPDQIWLLTEAGQLISESTDLCLETVDFWIVVNPVRLVACNGAPAQTWTIDYLK